MASNFKPTAGKVIMLLCFGVFEFTLLGLVGYLVYALIDPVTVSMVENGARVDVPLTIFQVIPLILVIGWIGFMIGYYAWCTYFYNFNFGKADSFWQKFVARVEEERQKPDGLSEGELYDEMAAPRENPYKNETFGFPPGTVRGSLALTIVVGGLALLINFVGGSGFTQFMVGGEVRDYFEFFKDAFLMVVAFYFGTKGLDIIQKEHTKREEALREAQARMATVPMTNVSDLAPQPILGSRRGVQERRRAPAILEPAVPNVTSAAPSAPTAAGKQGEAPRRKEEEDRAVRIAAEFPHVLDLQVENKVKEARKVELEPIDYTDFAKEHDLEVATVRAVCEVEAAGSGFLEDGRPKILFEGHVFWKQLKKYGVDPEPYAANERYRSVLYARWTRAHYKGGAGEYDRLALAREIHEDAALCSASWGLFQIMGYHFERLGYENVHEFVSRNEESARRHLEAFGRYIDAYNLDDFLRRKEWANFARRYNGPGYRENRYDAKLANAYQRFKEQEIATIERDLNQPSDVVSST